MLLFNAKAFTPKRCGSFSRTKKSTHPLHSLFCKSMEELLPENIYPSPAGTKTKVSKASLENTLIKAIIRDDKSKLIQEAKEIISSSDEPEQLDRAIMSNLLHLCCEFDSVNSAEALINGEINGVVPLTNEIDSSSGFAPLHTAAENHAQCCIELLIRKRARTDLKTKPKAAGNCNESGNCSARRLLPLELALRSRVEVNWAPDQPLDDLLLLLSEKELGAIRVLAEKTKDTGEVAYTLAIEGRVAALTALLMVAADKVNGSVLEMRTNTDLAPEKTSVYNCLIREAVSILLRVRGKHNRVAQDNKDGGDDGAEERRKVLLKEMELLHFFGAANIGCLDKKATSPLIIVSQAGDEAVMKLLLQTGINVGDADAEGNSALHWCLKASKVSSPEHIRILCLVLKHGARVRQKDKLGLTAVHIAAGNGNLEALKILVSQDPESVFVTSELKETPLFFAAKNDFIECAQLLMTCGATTEVLNLRRERPIDLAKSQDMRSALNRTSVVITNRVSQQKYTTCMHSDQVISESCETLVKELCSSSESGGSSGVDGEICKYFGSTTGCARGSTCFYRHIEEDLSSSVSKLRAGSARSTVLAEFKLKIFVGGLPPTMDSDSLADAMKEQFGPVTEANVLKIEVDDQLMSRGFGFVTFKNEKSAAAALDAHYTNIWGKKVEMKSAVPKWLLPQEEHTDETQQEKVQQESTQYPTQVQTRHIPREDILLEKMSWADRVGRQDDLVNEPKARRVKTVGQEVPVWLTTFKKWLPQFLRKMLRNSEGEYYSLSSLKSDFKSIFGLDLDHASLGYSKLSDFVKSMPELCRVKIVHTGDQVDHASVGYVWNF